MPGTPSALEYLAAQMRAWAVGLNVVYGMIGGGLLGLLIDWLAKTGPWFMLALGTLGLIAGTLRFIREARDLARPTATPPATPPDSENTD